MRTREQRRAWKYVSNILPDLKRFKESLERIQESNLEKSEPTSLDDFWKLFTRPRHARILESSQMLSQVALDDNLAIVLMSLVVIRENFDGVLDTMRLGTAEAELMMKRSFKPIIRSIEVLERTYREARGPAE